MELYGYTIQHSEAAIRLDNMSLYYLHDLPEYNASLLLGNKEHHIMASSTVYLSIHPLKDDILVISSMNSNWP